MKFAKPCYLVYQCACMIRLLCLQSRFNYHYGYHCDAIKICIHLVYLLNFRCFLVVVLHLLLLHSRLSVRCMQYACVCMSSSILFHLRCVLNPLISSFDIVYPHALLSLTLRLTLPPVNTFHTHTSSSMVVKRIRILCRWRMENNFV